MKEYISFLHEVVKCELGELMPSLLSNSCIRVQLNHITILVFVSYIRATGNFQDEILSFQSVWEVATKKKEKEKKGRQNYPVENHSSINS